MKKRLIPLLLLSALVFTGCNTPSSGDDPSGEIIPPGGDTDTFKSISIHKDPTKTKYFVGDYFEPAGLELDIEKKDDTHEYLAYQGHESDFTFAPSLTTPLKESDVKVTLTYKSLTLDIAIEVIDGSNIKELSINQNPTKTNYTEGECFEPNGLVLTAETTAGKSFQVAYAGNENEFTFVPSLSTPLSVNDSKVKATYKNATVDLDIVVSAKEVITVKSIEVKYNPKLSYGVGMTFDPTGLTLKVVNLSDKTETIEYAGNESKFAFSPSLSTPLATTNNKVTVTYGGQTVDLPIAVLPVAQAGSTLTLNFNAYKFAGTTKEISTTSESGKYLNALSFFANVDAYYLDNIVTNGYSGLKTIDNSKIGVDPFNVLQIASGTLDGELTLKFSVELKSVKIRAQSYYTGYMKTWDLEPGQDPYPVYSLDADTTMEVNGEAWELPPCEMTGAPEIVEKTFTTNSKSLVLSDGEDWGRIFIHSLELTF